MPLTDFLDKASQDAVVAAIVAAEHLTSGEIRVHVEPRLPRSCRGNAVRRAVEVFGALGMEKTRLRNGVLVYVAYRSRHLAIVGDKGINERVPAGFWDEELRELVGSLSRGKAAEGLCHAIASIGERLKAYFPSTEDDENEQSDEISYSE